MNTMFANGVAFLENQVIHNMAGLGVAVAEMCGIAVLLITIIQGMIRYFRQDPHIRLELAKGIALALEFKLGGEVLRTVQVRDWNELGILGAVIVLRAVLTLLLHWEINLEEKKPEDERNVRHPVLPRKPRA